MTTTLWYAVFGEIVPWRYAKGLSEALGRKLNELQKAIREGVIKEAGMGVDSESFFKWLRREEEVERIFRELQKTRKESRKTLQEIKDLLRELLKKR